MYVGNVGDSRAIACNNGIAEPLSTDHKPQDLEEKARIEKVGSPIFFITTFYVLLYFARIFEFFRLVVLSSLIVSMEIWH